MTTRTSSTFSRLYHKEPSVHHKVGTLPDGAGLPLAFNDLVSLGKVIYNPFNTGQDIDTTNNWTVTETQAGATQALSDDVWPSYCRLLNSAADNDVNAIMFTAANGAGETYRLKAGKKRYFSVRFRLGDANGNAASVTQNQVFLGFQITNTDQLGETTAVSDYIGFHKADGTGLWNMVSGKNNVSTGDSSLAASAATQIVPISTGLTLAAADACDSDTGSQGDTNGVYHRLSFLIKATSADATKAELFVWADGVHVASQYLTSGICDDEELCVCLAEQNGEAVAKALDVADFFCWFEN